MNAYHKLFILKRYRDQREAAATSFLSPESLRRVKPQCQEMETIASQIIAPELQVAATAAASEGEAGFYVTRGQKKYWDQRETEGDTSFLFEVALHFFGSEKPGLIFRGNPIVEKFEIVNVYSSGTKGRMEAPFKSFSHDMVRQIILAYLKAELHL